MLEAGDLELAVAEFRRVLQTDPDFADAHYNLAVALERLGGRAQARAHLERYLALDPSSSAWSDQAARPRSAELSTELQQLGRNLIRRARIRASNVMARRRWPDPAPHDHNLAPTRIIGTA